MQQANQKPFRTRASSVMLLLLARGEFKVLNIVLLLSIYGAAILAIPLILESFFELSGTFIGLPNENALVALLVSISNQAQKSYFLVLIPLFLGFVVSSLVSGISMGRRMKPVERSFSHLGIGRIERNLSIASAFLLVSLTCVALAFALSFVFASTALYSVSLLLHGPYFAPAVSFPFWVYLIVVPLISYVALIAGWSKVKKD